MKHIKISALALILNGATLLPAFGQEKIARADSISDTQSDYYRIYSVGFNSPIYRDFATSPLFYDGFGLDLYHSRSRRSTKSERHFDMGIGMNALNARIPQSDVLQAFTSAFLIQFNLSYSKLYELTKFSTDKNNIKVGGVIRSTQNNRVNPSLFNNALGLENSTNLMASGQIIRDVSRQTHKELNLWLFKPTLKPVKRDLRFQLNVGLLNFNYRPGYAYSYEAEVIGTETFPLFWILSNYKWSLNGFRYNTEIELIKYAANGNARSWSYVWDAISMPGRYENFQFASHQIRYRIFFHNKRQ